jgi:hypothetical protein
MKYFVGKFGTQSLKHLALRFRPPATAGGGYGTLIREKVLCARWPGLSFLVEISRNVCLDSMIPRDLWECL